MTNPLFEATLRTALIGAGAGLFIAARAIAWFIATN